MSRRDMDEQNARNRWLVVRSAVQSLLKRPFSLCIDNVNCSTSSNFHIITKKNWCSIQYKPALRNPSMEEPLYGKPLDGNQQIIFHGTEQPNQEHGISWFCSIKHSRTISRKRILRVNLVLICSHQMPGDWRQLSASCYLPSTSHEKSSAAGKSLACASWCGALDTIFSR